MKIIKQAITTPSLSRQGMKENLLFLLTFTMAALISLPSFAETAYVDTYLELQTAIANESVNVIVVTANIDVPCETSVTSTSNQDLTGASTAQLVINRSLTLQSQAGYKYTIKRIAANGATTDRLKSLISIRGDGNGTSGTANLSGNTVVVTFTNIIIDGGANWGTSTVSERRTAATTAYGNAGRAMIDVFMGGTLNLEDGVVLQNGFTTYSINSVVNNAGSLNYGGAVRVEYHANYGGGTVNVKAGAIIHDCTASGYGGGLGAYNFARLNLYGGTIYNCSANWGGAIGCTQRYQSDDTTSGTVRMYGGTIHDCCADNGGAISMDGTVTNYIIGGSIENCSASLKGSALCMQSGTTVNMVEKASQLLTISNCTSGTSTPSENTLGYEGVYNNATIADYPVYHVTFRNNDTNFAVLSVAQNTPLGEAFPAAPVNAGLRFVGWFNGNTQVTNSTTINSNITVTAKWDLLGSGTTDAPYLIPSTEAWNFLADQVAAGNNYSGVYFRQTADFTITKMVGVALNANDGNNNDDVFYTFNGVYDGYGHTLNLNLNVTGERYVGPFHCVSSATIKNLIVTGSVTVSNTNNVVESSRHPSALIGCCRTGSVVIENCLVRANVIGADYMGGIIGHSWYANITMTGCVFNGTLTAQGTNCTGGLIGWGGDNGGKTYVFSNNLFAGSYSGSGHFHPIGCLQTIINNNRTVTNTYYTAGLKNMTDDADNSLVKGLSYKGEFAYSISGTSEVTVANAGTATEYTVSGITSYGIGIKYGDTYYAGNSDEVSLTLSHGDKAGFTFNRYSVTGGGTLSNPATDTPTLTMTDAGQVINAQWIGDPPNWTYSSSGNVLSAYGEGGYTAENPLSITISAPADLQFDGNYKPATISNTAAWEAAGLTVPTILYNGITHAPSLLGTYTASISAGEKTADVTFTIKSVINYQSFFDNGLTRGTNFDVIATTGAYEVELNNTDNKGVYWDPVENCAVFDGEAYLQIDNPLGNVTAGSGLTITMDVWISSENNGSGTFIRSTGDQANKNGWQRLFDMSDGTTADCIFINAGNSRDGRAHIMFCLRRDTGQTEVENTSGQSFFNQWCTVTMVVAPGGYSTLYVNGELLTHSSSSDVSKIVNVLNHISEFNKCYIGTSIFEASGNNADGFFIGKIRGFQTAEGALMPYFDGSDYHYLLSYVTNGGNPITGTFEANIPENLPMPTRSDGAAEFAGWYMDEALTIPAESGTTLTHNTALYAKWTPYVETPPTANTGLVYSGAVKALVIAGTANLGTMKYSLDNSSWSTSIPTATNAGNYTVYYMVEGDDNHTDFIPSPNTVEVSIAKDPLKRVVTIADNKYVSIAPGNLQYVGVNTWRFAEHQWEYFGSTQANEHRDIFCWGTGNNPNNTSSDNSQYSTFEDWGTNIGSGWRTPTKDEWKYFLSTRANASSLCGLAQITISGATYNGLLILPDNWSGAAINTSLSSYANNSYDASAWAAMDAQGAIFIPAAGYRPSGYTGAWDVNSWGRYWTSTPISTDKAYYVSFEVSSVNPERDDRERSSSRSVRLVQEIATAPTAVDGLVYTGSAQTLISAGTANFGTMKYSLDNSSWDTSLPTATNAGDYTVYFMIEGDMNHEDFTPTNNTVAVTITPKTVTIPTAVTGLMWTGEEQRGVADGDDYTVTNGIATDIGNYTATATLTNTTNYQWSDATTADKEISWRIGATLFEAGATSDWRTWYNSADMTVSTDVMEAYVVTDVTTSESTRTVTVTPTNGEIYKNTPMLLKRKEGVTGAINVYASETVLTIPKELSESLSDEYIGNESSFANYLTGTVYMLAGSEFVRAKVTSTTTFDKSKCFIYLTSGNANNSRLIIIGDGPTGINPVVTDEVNNTWYTIGGRKLSKQPKQPGVYISNGKKVIVK